ncbi:family 7 glycoside hydrolase [Cryphonectria parasitica EP155]|uniref:Glucanase n=1 Tax=Cryphonectria parasitica (strain ATCC 38755 / EP155) TaxID=660469 RepID=A0A9P4XWR6_CRYP1|nr:family 7 glycoside hydrolase [Cryphonectria parasitica EP155]KAF3762714.1 family 7 glycoside hydrolase [Cryphonectria parasitica EP155]
MQATCRAAVTVGLLGLVRAQLPGTVTPEVHPQLTTSKCTTAGGCVTQNTSVVLDFGYRWLHTADYASCTTSSGINTTLCPDEATCAQNCVVEGANYTAAGVATTGSSMTMNQYVNSSTGVSSASPRVYLLDNDSQDYVMFQLLGQELTFDLDVSALPCGENGALYLSEMDATGGRNQYQTGGATYGSGYCDAQCPVQTFKNGTLNTNDAGYCCNEMDILESNSLAAAFTPHPCLDDGSDCDKSGCGFNPYSQGYQDYWAPGGTLDTTKPFTVTTQFITDDGTTTGTLTEIKRIYHQNNVSVPSAISGGNGDSINATWCSSVDSAATTYGNLETMGEALGRGMVLAFSIWNDASQYMDWLDEGSSGPCSSTAGNPALIQANNATTHVVFSNIKWGDINSTVAAAPSLRSRGVRHF